MKPFFPLDNLIRNACPSILFRVKRERLCQPLDTEELENLQSKILVDPLVKKIIDSQTANGWFGSHFHGYESLESGIRILIEKGVSPQHPALIHGLDALERDTEIIAKDLGSFGLFFDENRLGGARMIQAWLLSLGGRCDHPLVLEQVDVALEGMKSVIDIKTFSEATEFHRNKLIFKPVLKWPGIYHLRLLAYTQCWRSADNITMVAEAITKLAQFSPMPYALVRKGSQLIAPAAFAMLDLNPYLPNLDSPGWMMWFHRTELLARMGIAHSVESISQQLCSFYEMISQDDFCFNLLLKHYYFKRWGAYTGLMLESNWNSPVNRITDLTFRSLLILKLYFDHKENQS